MAPRVATLATGAMYSAADYVQAQRVRRVVQRAVGDLFTRVDLILTPTTITGAPTYTQFEENDLIRLHGTLNTMYWSAIGYPVLVVPMGFDAPDMRIPRSRFAPTRLSTCGASAAASALARAHAFEILPIAIEQTPGLALGP